MGREGSSPEEEDAAIEKLRETLRRMERALEAGPWIMGQQFTLADIGLIPTIVAHGGHRSGRSLGCQVTRGRVVRTISGATILREGALSRLALWRGRHAPRH